MFTLFIHYKQQIYIKTTTMYKKQQQIYIKITTYMYKTFIYINNISIITIYVHL